MPPLFGQVCATSVSTTGSRGSGACCKSTRRYRANFAFDLGAALRRVQAPALVLEVATAEEAHFGPQAEDIRALLPDGSALVMENTGRGALEATPADLARAVLDFLAG